jgi:RimJ/RimL family protein N-acetyltransferase
MAHNGRADRLGSWVARDRGTGNFLGWFMITPVDEPLRTVELAYRLRRRAWGRGYDIEGMLRMIEIARAAQVSTVIATTMAVDLASRRLMEKAGLNLVQTLRNPACVWPVRIDSRSQDRSGGHETHVSGPLVAS